MIESLATRYRLRVTRDDCQDQQIVGRSGTIGGVFAGRVVVIHHGPTARRWSSARARGLAAGMILHQDGDTEGSMLFDPTNTAQARTAIGIAGCRQRKQPSASQLAALQLHQFPKGSRATAAIQAAESANGTPPHAGAHPTQQTRQRAT